jgi:hypothetical protein
MPPEIYGLHPLACCSPEIPDVCRNHGTLERRKWHAAGGLKVHIRIAAREQINSVSRPGEKTKQTACKIRVVLPRGERPTSNLHVWTGRNIHILVAANMWRLRTMSSWVRNGIFERVTRVLSCLKIRSPSSASGQP